MSTRTSTQQGPGRRVIFRDWATTLAAIGGIVYSQLTGHVYPWLIGLYALLLGVPSAGAIVALLLGVKLPPTTGGPEESQPPLS